MPDSQTHQRVFWRTSRDRVVLLWAAWLTLASIGSAQSLWEVSPYQIEVWIAPQSHPHLDANWQQQLPQAITQLAANRIGAVWRLTARMAPDSFRGEMMREAEVDVTALAQQAKLDSKLDKLLWLQIRYDDAGYQLSVREVDLATRVASPWLRTTCGGSQEVTLRALELMAEAFVPLVRIERINDQHVYATLRAGALERPATSPRHWHVPTELRVGDVLQPVLLRSDRNGRVGPDGVRPIDWTLLTVAEIDGSAVTCQFQSGYREPFSTRRSSRIEQLAYRVVPRRASSTLRLVDRRRPEQPLVGYEVYRRRPDGRQAAELIGRSDFRGELTLSQGPREAVQVLFVRSGQQLLGKLPVVPGDRSLLIAPLRNDDVRLEAEGLLTGIQDSLVDLVARREAMAARIRHLIAEGELTEADSLLRELRQLDTADDFARRVQQRKQTLSNVDGQVQQRIDELFAQTRSLMGKYLNSSQVDELAQALEAARRSGS